MKRKIRVGSRESDLAMAQTKEVLGEIHKQYPELEFDIIGIKTKGDLILDSRLETLGGKGLFIKEIEESLLKESIDIAVHSLKDLPAEIPARLTIAAVSKREDPRDVLVTNNGLQLESLATGAVIGTSSIRRELQLLQLRPDLKVKTLRGNVLTRIDKLRAEEYDALVLAAAGLKRLGLEDHCRQYFDIREMIPAIGQGALAIETRQGDPLIECLVHSVHEPETALSITAERAFMIQLNGGCTTPIAAHAVIEGERMKIYGFLASSEGTGVYRSTIEGNKQDASDLGAELAAKILELSRKGKYHG